MGTESLVVDLGVAALLLLSGVLAMLRGLVHEVLGVLGWVGAAAAALFLYPLGAELLSPWLAEPWLRAAIAAFAIFLVALIVLSLIAGRIAGLVRDSALGPIDRVLGFAFGIARGAVIVLVTYIAASWLLPGMACPPWLAQARTLDVAEPATVYAFGLLPGGLNLSAPRPLCRADFSRRPTAEELSRPPRPPAR
jgi:membrane protein required for colicin V production